MSVSRLVITRVVCVQLHISLLLPIDPLISGIIEPGKLCAMAM